MSSGKYILSLDQGTTGSRAFLFDRRGKIVTSAYQEFTQYFPKPGWVEHDAEEIWRSCSGVVHKALAKANLDPRQVAAIGITNQRETTILWDRKTSRPLGRAIVWQCRRTADICAKLKRRGLEEKFRRKTGLVLDPYFSGTKVQWLLDHIKGVRRRALKGEVCFGTVDSWLIWKLTGGTAHVTDMTNASRTLFFNIREKKWDKELLSFLHVPAKILPRVQNSGSIFGYTAGGVAGLPSGIPIAAVLGDQQAALYGQGCYMPGTLKNTYGTGCFLVLNTGGRLVYSRQGLLSTLASDEFGRPVYALEGAIFIAGAVVQWLRDELKVIKTAPESEKAIAGLSSSEGVYFVPAFTGLGAPYWDSQARGAIVGLTRGSHVQHIIRAALEAIAYETRDVFDIMQKEFGERITDLKVDGGACRNNLLMQFQSDILNCRIIRPQIIESTAKGVALLAGVTVKWWRGKKDLEKMCRREKIFAPRMPEMRRRQLYQGWQKAVRQVRQP